MTPAGRPSPPLPHRRVLLLMCTGMLLVLLDTTAVNIAVPAIERQLHAGVSGVQAVVTAFTVCLAVLLLPAGALGDSYGHRRVMLAGLVLFGVASIGCATAGGVGVLIGARMAQGAGAALVLPTSMAIIARTYPDHRRRARALGIWAGVSGSALPAGPMIGGVLVSELGWRAVFWVNLPPVVLLGIGIAMWVGPQRDGDADSAGGGHGIGAAVLAMVRVPAFRRANAMALGMNAAANGTVFVVTLYLQSVRGYSAVLAGVLLLAVFVPLAVLSPVVGAAVARWGHRGPLIAGAACAAAGSLLLATVGRIGPFWLLPAAMALIGIGVAGFTTPVVSLALSTAPDRQAGMAGGANNTARQLGTALGVAVFGTLTGDPGDADGFVDRWYLVALVAASVWAVNLLVAATGRSGRAPGRPPVSRPADAPAPARPEC